MSQGTNNQNSFGLTQLVLRKNKVFWLLLVIFFMLGVFSYNSIPKEWTPDITIPNLFVVTSLSGASPIDSETLLTKPLEDQIQSVKGIKKLTSTSSDGVSVINVEFDSGVDIKQAKNDLKDAVDRAKPDLPSDANDPAINEINLAEQPIFQFNIASNLSSELMRQIADDLQSDLEGINGVLEVVVSGGISKEMQVNLDPSKLLFYNISIDQVLAAITAENANTPAGNVEIGSVSVPIRVPGEIQNVDDLSKIVLKSKDYKPIYLEDVAFDISFTNAAASSYARINGKDAISFAISKRAGENLQQVIADAKVIIDSWQQKLQGQIDFIVLDDQSEEVQVRLDDILNNLILGFIFVIIVLMVVMGVFNAAMVALAIPLSLSLAVTAFYITGITFNMVVLFSMVMTLGLVVDDAVVIVENIYRHFQMGQDRKTAVRLGVYEVAYPVITSTLTTIAAFFPMLFIPGIVGEFIRYLPITLISSLLASLIVALVFNPLICYTIMSKPKKVYHEALEDESQVVKHSRLLQWYQKLLNWALNHNFIVISSSFILFIVVMFLYFGWLKPGVEFFPEDEPSQAYINISAPYGSNLEESNRITTKIEDLVAPYYQYVDSSIVRVGQSRSSSSGNASYYSYITLKFPGWEDRKMLPSDIIVELNNKFKEPENLIAGSKIRMNKVVSGPPTGEAVAIQVSGPELNTLKKISLDLQAMIVDTPGLINLDDNLILTQNNIEIIPKRQLLSQYGITSRSLGRIVRTAINGSNVTKYRYLNDDYDIVVRYPEDLRLSVENIKRIPIITPTGQVNLEDLAEIKIGLSVGSIRHIDKKRTVTVSGGSLGVSGANLLRDIQQKIADYELPEGYNISYGGQDEAQKEMEAFMPKAFMAAIFLIIILMAFEFNSISAPLVILSTVFLSLIGVVLGLLLHNRPISIVIGGIGIIALAGVVVKNGIVLIDYILYKRKQGMPLREAIVLSSMLRVRPILLTAITSILGLMPIILGMDINFFRWPNVISFDSDAGVIWIPLANAIIYGLSVSTLLTLLFVPCVYYTVERSRQSISKFFSNLFGSSAAKVETKKSS